jgi:hypothetical protein
MPGPTSLVPVDQIAHAIHVIRGHRVMLDADLAVLYGVTTKRLNEAVKRNLRRFPADFMFQLTPEEAANLRSQFATSDVSSGGGILKSQFATSSLAWGGRRKLPKAFTEHGAVMLASVLNSPIAVEASIQVVRAFVQLRSMLAAHADLAHKLAELERKYDSQFRVVFDAIRRLMEPPPDPKRIGFRAAQAPDDPARPRAGRTKTRA